MKPIKEQPKDALEAITRPESARTGACISPADWASAPPETLQTLILTRMNLVKNMQRDIAAQIERMAEQMADAKVAEMLLALRAPRKEGQGQS